MASVLTLTATWVVPKDPFVLRFEHIMEAPNAQFWFGTDALGRDVFARVIYGARVSLYIGLVCMLLSATVGLFLGVASAYFGGKFDLIVQRFVDGIVAIPGLILALALVAALDQSMNNIIIAIAIVQTPRLTRVVRSAALSIKETPYVESARAIGATGWRIMLRHIIPNTFAPLVIIAPASLSFLGVGVPIRTISWGGMLSGDTREFFAGAPWMGIAPGVALTLVVFGINMFGDAIRDVLDPKLRGR